jgi:hypothetical protein
MLKKKANPDVFNKTECDYFNLTLKLNKLILINILKSIGWMILIGIILNGLFIGYKTITGHYYDKGYDVGYVDSEKEWGERYYQSGKITGRYEMLTQKYNEWDNAKCNSTVEDMDGYNLTKICYEEQSNYFTSFNVSRMLYRNFRNVYYLSNGSRLGPSF